MGLDQYLIGKLFIWSSSGQGGRREITELVGRKHPFVKGLEASTVVFEGGYWRKANQIHKWFVDNIQGGEDNCENYPVTFEQLKILYDLCIKLMVKKSSAQAKKLLPTTSGFFFGGTDYGPDYWNDIQKTIDILAPLFGTVAAVIDEAAGNKQEDSFKDLEYEYHSSW